METPETTSERDVRIEKLEQLRQAGIPPYAQRFEKSHSAQQAKELADGSKDVKIAGRVVGCGALGN